MATPRDQAQHPAVQGPAEAVAAPMSGQPTLSPSTSKREDREAKLGVSEITHFPFYAGEACAVRPALHLLESFGCEPS